MFSTVIVLGLYTRSACFKKKYYFFFLIPVIIVHAFVGFRPANPVMPLKKANSATFTRNKPDYSMLLEKKKTLKRDPLPKELRA